LVDRTVGEKFEVIRRRWIEQALKAVPTGSSLLDVGAGECANKAYAGHLEYVSQDIAQYDGAGDGSGLQTGSFDFSRIDIVCDLLDIPETRKFDCVLCTEVLEHVADPAASLRKLARLVKPGGQLLVTAPFCSLVHFAPYFYATGFSEYFYRRHLEEAGLEIAEITPNGGYYEWVGHEIGRVHRVYRQYRGGRLGLLTRAQFALSRWLLRRLAAKEAAGPGNGTSELLTNGFFVRATLAELTASTDE